MLHRFATKTLLAGLAATTLLLGQTANEKTATPADAKPLAKLVGERWKLSNEEISGVERLLAEEPMIRKARSEFWPSRSARGSVTPASQSCTERTLPPARAARSRWIRPVRPRWRRSRPRKDSGACNVSIKF